MNQYKVYIKLAILYIVVACFFACQQPGGNSPGSEYMPDMGHSVAYEANTYNYYYFNTWGTQDELYQMSQPRQPVSGTIARGYAGGGHSSDSQVPMTANGSVPYYYGDNDDERARASAERRWWGIPGTASKFAPPRVCDGI